MCVCVCVGGGGGGSVILLGLNDFNRGLLIWFEIVLKLVGM